MYYMYVQVPVHRYRCANSTSTIDGQLETGLGLEERKHKVRYRDAVRQRSVSVHRCFERTVFCELYIYYMYLSIIYDALARSTPRNDEIRKMSSIKSVSTVQSHHVPPRFDEGIDNVRPAALSALLRYPQSHLNGVALM